MQSKLKKTIQYTIATMLIAWLVFFILHFIFPLRINIDYSTTISDKNGNVLYAFLNKKDKWRLKTELNEISPELKKAIVYKEDKYFYFHWGINPLAIGRALFNNIVQNKRTSGASTITMQVARMLKPKRRTYANKLVEMFNALQLEWQLSKDEILQLYLNLVPYGSNIEGVKSASIFYLDKQPNHLSLAEITALSIIPNRPTSLLPGKNNHLITKERNKWLKRFLQDKIFSPQAINDALSEQFNAQRLSAPKYAPHFSFRMKNKFSEQSNIQTSLDLKMQLASEAVVQQYMKKYKSKNINNTAVIIIDNLKRSVLTYIGSNNFFDTKNAGQVDGVNSNRQPGSTLKPLLYALAIDSGLVTPKSIISDVPIFYNGYAPVNFNKEYNGYVSIEKALALSLNVPAVKMLNQYGVENFTNRLVACGFQSVARQQKILGLSVILGGCGTTLEELSNLYSSFAHNGKYQALHWLKNDTIAKDTATILSAYSSFMLSEMLTQLERPDLPNFWQNTKNLPKIAWKTGTSFGRKDAWSIGYNKAFTVGVWTGNFNGESAPQMTGSQTATPLLFDIFKAIDKTHNRSWLKKPKDLNIRLVCSASGNLPKAQCQNQVFDYFIPSISSQQECQHLKKHYISANDSMSYCLYCCPTENYKIKWIPNHSAEIVALYENKNINYQKIPPHNPLCEQIYQSNAPQIVAPSNASIYYLDKNKPEKIMLQCQAHLDADKVYWYINDVFFKSCSKTETLFFEAPKEGKIKISCADNLGRNSNISIEVKYIDLL